MSTKSKCTWDLYKSIPSRNNEGKTVFTETVEFNEKHKANSMARLVDSRRAKVPVTSMGFSMQDRIELLKLSSADEDVLGASCITDWLSPAFYELLGMHRTIPPITPHDKSLRVQFEALIKAFK
jgi:oleate hydratase